MINFITEIGQQIHNTLQSPRVKPLPTCGWHEVKVKTTTLGQVSDDIFYLRNWQVTIKSYSFSLVSNSLAEWWPLPLLITTKMRQIGPAALTGVLTTWGFLTMTICPPGVPAVHHSVVKMDTCSKGSYSIIPLAIRDRSWIISAQEEGGGVWKMLTNSEKGG